jgi:AraC family transcriptional regulator
MSLTSKALWSIERNLGNELSLDEVASSCAVSRSHLAHAFSASLGMSVMQYVRARRLTEAASALAAQAGSILELALDAGYGSHEAFTRAFRSQFELTPEAVRERGHTEGLTMTNAAKSPVEPTNALPEPRIVHGAPLIVAGLLRKQNLGQTAAIPGQWQKFMSTHYAEIDAPVGRPLSVAAHMDNEGNFDYLTGTEIAKPQALPPELTMMKIPAQSYAVFLHEGHVSGIAATYAAIWERWLPDNGRTTSNGPSLEKHMPTFDPRTGLGGVEIWLPLAD